MSRPHRAEKVPPVSSATWRQVRRDLQRLRFGRNLVTESERTVDTRVLPEELFRARTCHLQHWIRAKRQEWRKPSYLTEREWTERWSVLEREMNLLLRAYIRWQQYIEPGVVELTISRRKPYSIPFGYLAVLAAGQRTQLCGFFNAPTFRAARARWLLFYRWRAQQHGGTGSE